MFNLSKKLQHSLIIAVVFFLVSSPLTYRLVDKVVGSIVGSVIPHYADFFKVAQAGCPTTYGLVLHTVVFFLVSYFLVHA